MIGAVGERTSVRLRARQDVVLVRLLAGPLDWLILFTEHRRPAQVVSEARGLDRVAMEVRHIRSDLSASRVVPGSLADAIPGVHGRLAARCARAEVCTPRPVAGPGR